MIFGYNERRPTIENYANFIIDLEKSFRNLGEFGVSLMIYGSYIRGDYNPGRSDIDSVLIYPDNVIINKKILDESSRLLSKIKLKNNISYQVTVTDLKTMCEGRFNSFDPNFFAYFQDEAKILIGPDYRDKFTFTIPDHSDQNSLRFNLRKSRLSLLFKEYNRTTDYERYLEQFNKTLDSTSRASKQILSMIDGNIRKNRFSALVELEKVFPNLDLEPLIKIKSLYNNLNELDNLYQNPNALESIWNESVTFFESLIKNYIEKY